MWNNRKYKEIARDYIFSELRHIKNGIWLEGEDWFSLLKAIRSGICDKKSTAFVVERSLNAFLKMGDKASVEDHALSQTNIRLYKCNLENFVPPKAVDFAFIDLLGSFTPSMLLWFSRVLSKKIAENGRLCFSHTYKVRNNNNFNEIREVFKHDYKDVYDMVNRLWKFNGEDWISLPALMLKCCFNRWNFVLKQPGHYRDTKIGMIVYRCEKFVKKDSDFPCMEEVLDKTSFGKSEISKFGVKSFGRSLDLYQKYCIQEELPDKSDRITSVLGEILQ